MLKNNHREWRFDAIAQPQQRLGEKALMDSCATQQGAASARTVAKVLELTRRRTAWRGHPLHGPCDGQGVHDFVSRCPALAGHSLSSAALPALFQMLQHLTSKSINKRLI
jgi:hypothetical protein